jgi:hypothetical protein
MAHGTESLKDSKKDKKDKSKRKSGTFLHFLGKRKHEVESNAPKQPKNGAFGVVGGFLRGQCQVPDCGCKSFKQKEVNICTWYACFNSESRGFYFTNRSEHVRVRDSGHFPASHQNLGVWTGDKSSSESSSEDSFDMLAGLEGLRFVEEADLLMLVPEEPSRGAESWPRKLNPQLPVRTIVAILCGLRDSHPVVSSNNREMKIARFYVGCGWKPRRNGLSPLQKFTSYVNLVKVPVPSSMRESTMASKLL